MCFFWNSKCPYLRLSSGASDCAWLRLSTLLSSFMDSLPSSSFSFSSSLSAEFFCNLQKTLETAHAQGRSLVRPMRRKDRRRERMGRREVLCPLIAARYTTSSSLNPHSHWGYNSKHTTAYSTRRHFGCTQWKWGNENICKNQHNKFEKRSHVCGDKRIICKPRGTEKWPGGEQGGTER